MTTVDGPSFLRFTKNFFFRFSPVGFQQAISDSNVALGLGVNQDYVDYQSTPGFNNGESYIVYTLPGVTDRPAYLNVYFHALLVYSGLGVISNFIMFFYMPGFDQHNNGPAFRKLKIRKVLLQ